MKKLLSYALTATLCLIVNTSCKAQKLFSDLAAIPDVESTYIGPLMINTAFAHGIVGDGEFGGMLPSGMIEKINSIEIISAEHEKTITKLKAEAKKILKNLKLEILLETNDDEDTTVIYAIPAAKGEFSNLIIVSSEICEYNLIHIAGKFKLTEQAQKQE